LLGLVNRVLEESAKTQILALKNKNNAWNIIEAFGPDPTNAIEDNRFRSTISKSFFNSMSTSYS
jgi:hypothetical protein